MSKMGQELEKRLDENKYKMYDALQEIAKAEGKFSMNRLTFAENVIEAMQEKAKKAIALVGK